MEALFLEKSKTVLSFYGFLAIDYMKSMKFDKGIGFLMFSLNLHYCFIISI
ncbi:hypothetical protein SAMN04488541_103213 [Thermoflexibacter ruber]|uniref:Uncharacterized protein n=1 Tax=Thermoflexibacter ruber TaxID=1003 RepID=A0A1I2IL54_9BACT|nr:hypothetical protein SAMN04488541_103213 [Thermoflexibacter ruber]